MSTISSIILTWYPHHAAPLSNLGLRSDRWRPSILIMAKSWTPPIKLNLWENITAMNYELQFFLGKNTFVIFVSTVKKQIFCFLSRMLRQGKLNL